MNEPSQVHPRRFEQCRECKRLWNVSRQAVISESGYLCPQCRNNQQRQFNRIGAKDEKKTE